ncbi:hypothetical protein J2T21_002430 [Paeniglutamicibacter psychrophenolicus]|nr:hypothetical protein [Paeniglutamicibacter psychrophenolicus]
MERINTQMDLKVAVVIDAGELFSGNDKGPDPL